MSHPGPTLSEVEQLEEYRRVLSEMVAYVTPDLKTSLQAEILMVENRIDTLLENYVASGKWPES